MGQAKIRLYLDQRLGAGQPLALSAAQAHYLFAVMRQGTGAPVLVFNGSDGEWLAEVTEAGKRGGSLTCRSLTRRPAPGPDLWLLFAPVKKTRTDFIVEKAVELGAARLLPVQTEHTNSERIRQDRLQAHALEAAEQCGALAVPEVADLTPLPTLLASWTPARRILWADEAGAGAEGTAPLAQVLAAVAAGTKPGTEPGTEPGGWALLIGPEGGFSAAERAALQRLPFVTAFCLGPRILRADTAAVAALSLWQAALGDWR